MTCKHWIKPGKLSFHKSSRLLSPERIWSDLGGHIIPSSSDFQEGLPPLYGTDVSLVVLLILICSAGIIITLNFIELLEGLKVNSYKVFSSLPGVYSALSMYWYFY